MDEDKDHLLLLGAQTKDWPNGLAYKGLQKLSQHYARQDLYTAVYRNAKLEAIKLKKGDGPDKLFGQIMLINVMYKDRVDPLQDNEVLNLVIRKLPKRYGDGILMEARRLGANLTLKAVQELTVTMYRGWNIPSGKEEHIQEVALSANYTCYECGQGGHKASDCPKRRAGNQSKGQN